MAPRERHAATNAQDKIGDVAGSTSVTIIERVNRLELRVRERCLYEWRKVLIIDPSAEIREEAGHLFRRWRDKVGPARVVVTSADPVLSGSMDLTHTLQPENKP